MKRIAFIMSTFPTLTETFVAGEIKILMERFPNSEIYSLRPPFDKILHSESETLMQQTNYVAAPMSMESLKSNLRYCLKHPIQFFSTLLYITIHTAINPLHMLKSLYIFPQAVHLAQIVNSRGITHIHSHWASYPTTIALIIHRLLGIPFSFTSHACDMSMIKTLMAEKVKQASFVATCTAENIRYLSSFLDQKHVRKVQVNYHGSNLSKFSPEFHRNGNGAHSITTIVSCADLHERKGFPYLIRALALLKQRALEFRCFIVGEGPQRPILEQLIDESGLKDMVKMPGAVTQETLIRDYYAIADMFVLPCVIQQLRFFRKNVDLGRYKILECLLSGGEGIQKDGIPNVLVEAMAMKIPVISTSIAAIPELISNGKNGLLVPEKDSIALCDAIHRLIRDDELRKDLAEAGFKTVHEKFDRSKNIEQLVEIFQKDWPPPRTSQIHSLSKDESISELH